MGAGWSVTLVSKDGEEISVPADVLSSVSSVWRERLQLAGTLSPTPRSVENCSADEIKAFVQVIMSRSHEAETNSFDISIKTLVMSLRLVHKYDCKGIKLMMDELDAHHFPDLAFKTSSGMLSTAPVGWIHPDGTNVLLTPGWLTQTHMDYLVSKQELYGEDAVITKTMKKLLSKLLTVKMWDNTYFKSNAAHPNAAQEIQTGADTNAIVQVQHRKPKESAAGVEPCLTLEAWRLSSTTLASLLPYMQPNWR